MAVGLRQLVRHVHGLLADRETAGLTDVELWQRYVQKRDQTAFAALVSKHGPMVFGVCRRILGREHDAEDAFQATFLVLVRKAAALRSPRTLANWLHGVARRTALEARRSAAKRQVKEQAALPRAVSQPNPKDDWGPVLDQELEHLAEKYRIAVILCDLEGKTRKEVARQLGCSEGTVASRLARGRNLLARRLARQGFPGALGAAALADASGQTGVSSTLVVSALTAARSVPACAALSGRVALLTEGVLKSMHLSKLKSASAALLLIGLATLTAGAIISPSGATEPTTAAAEPPQQERRHQEHLHDQMLELKKQLRGMEEQLANLERDIQPPHDQRRPDVGFLADRFKHKVAFELGRVQTNEGGGLQIREVWGTRPVIEVGGQYLVRGTYALPPGVRGRVHFYATAGGAWGALPTTLDLQSMDVHRERGEFALVHGMSGPGHFHLILTEADRYSHWFADVYFGTGDNVWRKKP
jgi:RNA polymerase sigma factor (sigma-70 family)